MWTLGRAAIAVAGALIAACASSAQTVTSAPRSTVLAGLTMNGQPIACVTQPDGVRVCHGNGVKDADFRVKSFDGTPLSLYVTLPPAALSGPG